VVATEDQTAAGRSLARGVRGARREPPPLALLR
jgi:hypothetical protein